MNEVIQNILVKMNYFKFKTEKVLITVTFILSTILILKLLYWLRKLLPWRVNCWFCNCNFWVKFFERNSWTCPKCEQYNGFNKEGDYNKPIVMASGEPKLAPKIAHGCPPSNGLCKMCNINQQLKVAQLANFVPMNDKNFEDEVESYRSQLERAYRLCSPCKKVVQMKLHKEKEVLLGKKLLEKRSPDKKGKERKEIQTKRLQSFINKTSMYVAGSLLFLVTFECYSIIVKDKSLLTTITNIKDIISGLLERILTIAKMKLVMTFPMLESYFIDVKNIELGVRTHKYFDFATDKVDNYNTLTQQVLGGFVSIIQIVGHIWNLNKLGYAVVTDVLWSIFVVASIAHYHSAVHPIIISLIKLTTTLAVLCFYRKLMTKVRSIRKSTSPKVFNIPSHSQVASMMDDGDLSMETDDDVSLSNFGLHNFSESSNETISPKDNKSMMNGRSFTPRGTETIWNKPKHNSTFCVNPVLKSPSSVSENIFPQPNYHKLTKHDSFHKYQKLEKDDSDSDLDESISSLFEAKLSAYTGSPKKNNRPNSVFSLPKFTASSNFVAPTPLNRSRPLISPSKLAHSTSWVAGGYWGSDSDRQIFSANGSRSSSQSSGFESQASSMNQRNPPSQPPSREESVCGDHDRSVLLDRFQNCNVSNFSAFQVPQNFSRISSPVFPQMQYNGHVHIPQPRFPQTVPNVFSNQHVGKNSMFKTPSGSGLIRLPQVNSFASH